MNTHDDDRDAEMTSDWPGAGRAAVPGGEDGEATAVVPKTPHGGTAATHHGGTPPPMSPPQHPAPPMSPPPSAPWNPQWQNTSAGAPPGGGGGWTPPSPPGQYPPGYPPAPAVTPQKGTPWGLIGVGGVAVALVAVVATWFVMRGGDASTPSAEPASSSAAPGPSATGSSSAPSASASASPPPSATPAAIEPTALKGLLASVPEINTLVGAATMTPNATFDAAYKDVTVDPFTCTGAVQPGAETLYLGSGFTGFAGQLLTDAPQDNKVLQYVASFPSEAEAKAFVDKQVAGWEACKFTDVTLSTGGGQVVSKATVGVTANTDGTPSVFIFPPGGTAGRQCQHAMTPRKNVVVDVRVCAPSVGSMGWTLARDIGQKITGQR
jgi:serine/threonine kinase PknH